MRFSVLNNSCAESAVLRAMKQFFPQIRAITFNGDGNAQNDFQIPLQQVFSNTPGRHETLIELSNKTALQDLLAKFDPNAIYCVRTGYNNQAGHFSYLYFAEQRWVFANRERASSDMYLTDTSGKVLGAAFHMHFRVRIAGVCGLGNNQYSVRFDELTLPRTIAAMNYIGSFRNHTDEDGVNDVEMVANEQFETLIMKEEDYFLHLTIDACQYWGINNDALNIDEHTTLMHQSSVYAHMLCHQGRPDFLPKLQRLPGFDIQAGDEQGDTLLHRAVRHNSLASVQALILVGADVEWLNNQGHNILDVLEQLITETTQARGARTPRDVVAEEFVALRRAIVMVQSDNHAITVNNAFEDVKQDAIGPALFLNTMCGVNLYLIAGILIVGGIVLISCAATGAGILPFVPVIVAGSVFAAVGAGLLMSGLFARKEQQNTDIVNDRSFGCPIT